MVVGDERALEVHTMLMEQEEGVETRSTTGEHAESRTLSEAKLRDGGCERARAAMLCNIKRC